MTIYVLAFVATLSAATLAAALSGNWRCWVGAAVLILNFAGSHFAWNSGNAPLINAAADVATAAWFVLAGSTRWELTIGGIFLLSALSAVAANFGLFPPRPLAFLAWSYPDVTNILGHLASITLGLGAGDAGVAVRRFAARRPVVAGLRHSAFARLGLVAQGKG